MAEKLNLHQRLLKIGQELNGLVKNGHHTYPKYDYITLDDINEKLKPACEKHGVTFNEKETPVSETTPFWTVTKTVDPKDVKKEKETWTYQALVTVTLTNADNPEETDITTYPVCEQNTSPSKARGSAKTYGRRYFVRDKFNLSDCEDDPDNDDGNERDSKNTATKATKATKPKITPQTPDPALATSEQIQSLFETARRKGFDEGRVRDVIAKECGNAPMTVEQFEKILKPLLKREDKVTEEGEIKETAA